MSKKKTRKTKTFEGLPVVDATKDLDLHVLAIDVKGASKKNPAQCAAARAGSRELKKDVRVFLSRTYVKEKKHWVRYVTPQSAAREIVSFDRGSAFEPGEYVMKAPGKTMKLGAHRGYNYTERDNHESKGIKKKYHATGLVRARSHYGKKEK